MDLRRKLAAILSADVKGYSRLMGDDEEATVRTITTTGKGIPNRASKSSRESLSKVHSHYQSKWRNNP